MMRAPVLALTLALTAGGAMAQSTETKALIVSAKARDLVGEQGDGYLGLVTGQADPAVKAAVAEINAGRAATYRGIAAKSGVSERAAGEATGRQLYSRLPPGSFYRPIGGTWMRR